MAKFANGKHLLTDANGNYYGVSAFYNGEHSNPFVMRDNGISRNSGFNEWFHLCRFQTHQGSW